jgi:hypothetical protein
MQTLTWCECIELSIFAKKAFPQPQKSGTRPCMTTISRVPDPNPGSLSVRRAYLWKKGKIVVLETPPPCVPACSETHVLRHSQEMFQRPHTPPREPLQLTTALSVQIVLVATRFFFLRRNVLTSSALIGVPVCQTQAFWPGAHATRDLGTAVESDQDVFELKCV